MRKDQQFIEYMKTFEASVTHVGECAPCQADEACAVGKPIHAAFIVEQDTYESRR